MSAEAPLIELRAVTKIYGRGESEVRALGGVDLRIEDLAARRKAETERDLEEEIDRRTRIAAEDIVRRREEEAEARRPRKTT